MVQAKEFLEALVELRNGADREAKERGERIAAQFRFRRLSYQRRKELQHASHQPRGPM